MASTKKVLNAVLARAGTVGFRDFERLLTGLGFRLDRVTGSHHIYLHPKVTRPMNIQPIGKDAKPYQVRQLRDMIVEHGLEVD